nr:G protein-coupled receptor [Proales similis]
MYILLALIIALGSGFLVAKAQHSELLVPALNECQLSIVSVGNEPLLQAQLDLINTTVARCESKKIYLNYRRKGQFISDGESLGELTEYIQPLIKSGYSFGRVRLNILESKGMSAAFRLPYLKGAYQIVIYFVLFDFTLLTLDGAPLNNCSPDIAPFKALNGSAQTFMVFNKAIRYHPNTCANIFDGAFMEGLGFRNLADCTVKHNLLTFRPIINQTLYSFIGRLILYGYGLRFDARVFPLAIFRETAQVVLSGMVHTFEPEALRQSSVTYLELTCSRLRLFLHNNPNWLNQANQRSAQDTLMVYVSYPDDGPLTTSDKDYISYISSVESNGVNPFDDSSFCIFYQIELHSLNVMLQGHLIEREALKNCNCLLFWIVSRHFTFADSSLSNESEICAEQLSEPCQFDKMSQRCSIEKIEALSYRTIYDTIFDLEYFRYLTAVWLMPAVGLLGVVANYLVIRTFRKMNRSHEYRRNKLTDKSRHMWQYSYYNSWFFLLHGAVCAFTPLTTCIELDGIYCSPLVLTKISQVFHLFAENVLGNTFRLMANISGTLFVFFRFGLNTEKFARFRGLKPKALIICLIFPTFIFSLIKLFVNERFNIDLLFQDSYYYLTYNFDQFRQGLALKMVNLLNIFLGTTFFTLLNIIVDLKLLRVLRVQNADRPKDKAEARITKMIVLNGMFSFLFRVPEMASASLLVVFAFDNRLFPVCILRESRFHSVCPMLFAISRLLLTISYVENLVLLFVFNQTFRKNLFT